MHVHRNDARRAKCIKDFRKNARGDRLARPRFAILTRITKIRNDDRDFAGGRAARSIYGEEESRPIVGWRICRLNQENVLAAQIFLKLDAQFAVGKDLAHDLAERHAKAIRDFLRKRLI